ncbi:hypothetical protein GCM10008014_13800 [Paenibacillus silvae]|uniref:Aminoglycoside phosphotransferase domain-containing protein n=1 Tax=Paenibacillus silvae TaxID=1325358 RepID=A0ABQ1Z3X2_9BACL|nr:phosphotransferase [Paenibacillus silvae]GGH49376.1 hypothetical protein GCM10008014_13800 [Paenibacillus silvae]
MQLTDIPSEMRELIGNVKQITIPRQGHTSSVTILHTSSHSYVIKKTEHELYNEWLADEYKALKHLEETALPVSTAHSFFADQNARWLLMDYMEGVTLRRFLIDNSDQKQRDKAIASFGRCLKQLHECSCPMDWQHKHTEHTWLDTMISKAEYNLANFAVDGNAGLLTYLKENRPGWVEPTLIHGDFTTDNVLVRDGQITGVIDWAGAAYGDPRYDVALAIRPKASAFEEERDKDVFYDAYGKRRLTDEEYRYFEQGIYNFF